MANKPIKQYATLTDEAGVEAMTVATGGAVTVGASNFTGAHTLNGKLKTVTSSTSCASGSNTALLTLATLQDGYYQISVWVSGYTPSQLGYVGLLLKNPSSVEWILTNLHTSSTLTISENNSSLIANQVTGSTQTVELSVLRIG